MSGKQKAAFTLAEIMISIGIMGILAIITFSATQFSNKDEKVLIGKKQQAESLIISVSKALASGDTTGLALTNLTKDNKTLRDGFAPKLNTKNAQAVVNDFSGYNTPEKFIKPASLPAVELTNGTKVAFQKLNTSCATASDGGAPCALAYVDVNEKAAGGETPQFLMAIYRDRAVSEYELCEGYEGGKTTDVECPANLPNGNKKKIETCNLGVITATYRGVCCPSDQTPNGDVCVCKNPDMVLAGGTCVCKDNKVNINGACVCEGKEEACPSNTKKIGKIIYDGICSAEGKSFELKENACKCPTSLPNEASTGICYAACSGGKIFEDDICKCPENLPTEINGVCACPNIVKSCSAPKIGNITYATTCSVSGKIEGDKLTDTCTCPSKDKLSFGDKEIYSPSNESCKSECPDLKVSNSAHTTCVCPKPLIVKDNTCECPQTPPTGYLASNEAWNTSNTKTCKRLKNVYIVASYKNTETASSVGALKLGENILDFASITYTRGNGAYSGSGVHNKNTVNDTSWMILYNKMSASLKNKTFLEGEAYVILEDGTLLTTISSAQIMGVSYTTSLGINHFVPTYPINKNFSIITPISGLNNDYTTNGEEGMGGQIKYNGLIYDVVYTIYRKDTPLVLDLKDNGFKFTDIPNGVEFDLNADGKKENTGWTDIQSEFDDAFLIYDKNNNAQVDDGKELFGNQSGSQTGFDELAKYDNNNDGLINRSDDIFDKLQLWCDMNKNGKTDEGELKTLKKAKITELSLDFEKKYDENGNLIEDEHGNTTGLVGSFKIMTEQIVDGVVKMIETVRTMIDVLFNTVQSFFG